MASACGRSASTAKRKPDRRSARLLLVVRSGSELRMSWTPAFRVKEQRGGDIDFRVVMERRAARRERGGMNGTTESGEIQDGFRVVVAFWLVARDVSRSGARSVWA